MDQIQLQASKLWDLIFSEETGETYQKTLSLTGTILKESALLIWLIICSVFGDASMKTGNGLRTWIERQNNPSLAPAEDKKPLAETGKALLANGRSGFDNFLNTAREQLGLEPVEPTPMRKPSFKAAASKPAAAPAAAKPKASSVPSPAPATSAPAQSAPSAATSPTSEVIAEEEEISREPDSGDWPPQELD